MRRSLAGRWIPWQYLYRPCDWSRLAEVPTDVKAEKPLGGATVGGVAAYYLCSNATSGYFRYSGFA
jgi:hypothetical protein